MRVIVLGTMVILSLSGCQSAGWKLPIPSPLKPLMEKRSDPPTKNEALPPFGEPQRLAVVWKDSVLQGVGKGPTVGFSGQVYLYDTHHQPIRAEGQLVIYGYEETDHNPSVAADKKFVFPLDKFQSHYQPTALGATYNVWIPWEKVGGDRKTVTLIPVFKTADGRVIRGEQALAVLPGKTPDEEMLAKTDIFSFPVRPLKSEPQIATPNAFEPTDSIGLANHQSQSDEKTHHQAQIISSSIEVPRHLAKRLAALPPSGVDNAGAAAHDNTNDRATSPQRSESRHSTRTVREPKWPPGRLEAQPDPKNQPTSKTDSRSDENTMPTRRPVFGMPGSFGR